MALIAGLGNPGPEYANTRHNIGFELADLLSAKLSIPLNPDNGLCQFGEGRFKGQQLILLKPTTFMNRSGTPVRKMMTRYGFNPDQVLVCYDDIHLDIGRIRLRPGGSAGGHNGVADIIEKLQTRDFPRLRIGIGSNFGRGRQSDYVLSPFTASERDEIDATLEVASDAILTFLRGGIDLAMNKFN
jgi:peptidyl-tRNA hydrolase, PTH1 family